MLQICTSSHFYYPPLLIRSSCHMNEAYRRASGMACPAPASLSKTERAAVKVRSLSPLNLISLCLLHSVVFPTHGHIFIFLNLSAWIFAESVSRLAMRETHATVQKSARIKVTTETAGASARSDFYIVLTISNITKRCTLRFFTHG